MVASLERTPLFDDDPRAFADLVQSLEDHYQPQSPYERACVEDIAICQCPSAEGRRVAIAETGHIACPDTLHSSVSIGASAQTVLLSGPGADNPRLREKNALPDLAILERLNRYEVSLQRQLKRSFDTLTALSRERSQGGQANPSLPRKQRADQSRSTARQNEKDEMGAIRREVLGIVLADLASHGNDPASESIFPAPDTQSPGPISANQTQIPAGGLNAGASIPRALANQPPGLISDTLLLPNKPDPHSLAPDTRHLPPAKPSPVSAKQSPATVPEPSPSAEPQGEAAVAPSPVSAKQSHQAPIPSDQLTRRGSDRHPDKTVARGLVPRSCPAGGQAPAPQANEF